MDSIVYIIILNYNGKENTLQCIESLMKYDHMSNKAHIVVVDNASTDGSEDALRSAFGNDIEIIRSPRNLGYAGGNNIGIKHAIEQGAQYICLMNNDIVVEEDFIADCVNTLKADKKAAFVAPGIANYYTNLCDNTGAHIYIKKGKEQFLNEKKKREEIPRANIKCDMVEGSCLMFDVDIVREIGFLPEAYFMYYEETEWCYRAVKKGYHCVSMPTKWVYHKKRESVKKGFYEYMMERNRIVFVRRNATPREKFIFSFYIIIRDIQYSRKENKSLQRILKMQLDGLFNKKSEEYPFINIS